MVKIVVLNFFDWILEKRLNRFLIKENFLFKFLKESREVYQIRSKICKEHDN